MEARSKKGGRDGGIIKLSIYTFTLDIAMAKQIIVILPLRSYFLPGTQEAGEINISVRNINGWSEPDGNI